MHVLTLWFEIIVSLSVLYILYALEYIKLKGLVALSLAPSERVLCISTLYSILGTYIIIEYRYQIMYGIVNWVLHTKKSTAKPLKSVNILQVNGSTSFPI